jgi:hypothetical protein
MSQITVSVNLEIKTCGGCGSVYAIPCWLWNHQCPRCAGEEHDRLARDLASATTKLSRLRGVITRLQRAKKSARQR